MTVKYPSQGRCTTAAGMPADQQGVPHICEATWAFTHPEHEAYPMGTQRVKATAICIKHVSSQQGASLRCPQNLI